MQVININDVYILVKEINKVSSSRRSNERMAITELLGEAIPGARLGHHLNGAPFVHDHPNINISVAHSQSHAAIAIAEFPIGIDVEAPRQQLERVAQRFLSRLEFEDFNRMADGLLKAWTAKEAVFKCAGFENVDFIEELHISATGTAKLRDKSFTLHWLNLGGQMLCLAL